VRTHNSTGGIEKTELQHPSDYRQRRLLGLRRLDSQ
jgi:hypothetical protein